MHEDYATQHTRTARAATLFTAAAIANVNSENGGKKEIVNVEYYLNETQLLMQSACRNISTSTNKQTTNGGLRAENSSVVDGVEEVSLNKQ
jgi:hypothetical protein